MVCDSKLDAACDILETALKMLFKFCLFHNITEEGFVQLNVLERLNEDSPEKNEVIQFFQISIPSLG